MPTVSVQRTIAAPINVVFRTVSDISQFAKAIPHIVEVEFLTDRKVGVGTRFRETRMMKGKKVSTELEVTEYIENDRVRLIADSYGTIWDSLFTVRDRSGQTELNLVMEARTKKLFNKIMNLLIVKLIQKAVEQDMDSTKAYCEANRDAGPR